MRGIQQGQIKKRSTKLLNDHIYIALTYYMPVKQMVEVEIWPNVGRVDSDFLGEKALGWDSENQGLRL